MFHICAANEGQCNTRMWQTIEKGKAVPAGGKLVAQDPVCKMHVDESTAKAKSDYKDQTYYFCSLDCKEQFDNNPERYTRAA